MSQISYTFLRNNHTKQGRISTWTREQPGKTRKEKMMGDYTEHLINMAGGDGDVESLHSRRSAKFKAWQSVDCAWCDLKAAGNALHVYDGQWFASCGKHGRKYEPFQESP